MIPAEKHREAARIIAMGAAHQVNDNDDARAVETLVSGLVAVALANAEREGMKRAAEIAKAHYDARHAALARAHGMNIATAILSEAGEDAQ